MLSPSRTRERRKVTRGINGILPDRDAGIRIMDSIQVSKVRTKEKYSQVSFQPEAVRNSSSVRMYGRYRSHTRVPGERMNTLL